ncbi:hypothetical protein ACFS7Z_13850 [Pontibacter toksunensis]|uniref:Uncharacterized protein n=1 Tax=Pontibacter toksunensis TaxID=1332631 RepID=A0ABW6BW23_9BACT
MIITINTELLRPLMITAFKFGIEVNEPRDTERDGQLEIELPESWSSNHWFEFGLQAGLDLQFKSTLILND